MDDIKVSIIVSMYNGEKYIRDCLDSIVKQSHKNLEILLVDDGSPDKCGEIADAYALKDLRINVLHQQNSGVSISRNHALSIATGKYICIVDQDDILSTGYVEYFLNLCESNNAEIALTPNVDKFFSKIRIDNKPDFVKVICGEAAAKEMLFHKYVIAPWNKIIRLDLITNGKIQFNTDFFNGEGFAFSIECLQTAKRVVVGSKRIYHYRVGDPHTGASVYKEAYLKSSLNAQEYIRSKLVNQNEDMMKAWRFSNWHTHCDAFNIMVGCSARRKNEKLYKELYDYCQKEALCALGAPISMQQKLRGVLFKCNPYIAAKIINHFRNRKFAKVDEDTH